MRTSESICSLAHRPESPERDGRVVVVVVSGRVGEARVGGGSDQFIFSLLPPPLMFASPHLTLSVSLSLSLARTPTCLFSR